MFIIILYLWNFKDLEYLNIKKDTIIILIFIRRNNRNK